MKRVLCLVATIALAACNESSGPGGVTQLSIVRQGDAAPPLITTRDSFWVPVGDDRELRLFYQGAQPGDTGEEFLRFEVPGDGLYRKPDGSAFQAGDSILITVTVVDPSRFLFDFEPAGLQFHPEHPASLRVRYENGDKDFDDDGDEDEHDDEIETQLDLWYRRTTIDPWFRVGGVHFEEADEIDAHIRTFSQYAVAW